MFSLWLCSKSNGLRSMFFCSSIFLYRQNKTSNANANVCVSFSCIKICIYIAALLCISLLLIYYQPQRLNFKSQNNATKTMFFSRPLCSKHTILRDMGFFCLSLCLQNEVRLRHVCADFLWLKWGYTSLRCAGVWHSQELLSLASHLFVQNRRT